MVIQPGTLEYSVATQFQRGRAFPYWTMGILLKGKARIVSGKRHLIVEPGTFAVIEPDTSYSVDLSAGLQEVWCCCSLKPKFVRLVRSWPPFLTRRYQVSFIRSCFRDEIIGLMKSMPGLAHSLQPESKLLLENTLERILLLVNAAHIESIRPPLDERVFRARAFLLANLCQPMTLREVAVHVHASPSRLAHLFSEQVGKSPMSFHEYHRIQKAIGLLLSTNLRVREVAEELGYINPYHFCVRFKKMTGMAPRDFRRSPSGMLASESSG